MRAAGSPIAVLIVASCCPAALTDEECQRVQEAQQGFGNELCRRTLEAGQAGHLQFALAGLWLNQRVQEANDRLRQAQAGVLGGAAEMTPDLAAQHQAKWSMRMWLRIYYLFREQPGAAGGPSQTTLEKTAAGENSSKDQDQGRVPDRFAGARLAGDVQAGMEDLFWNYGLAKSRVERAQLKYIWHIQESENHDMMDLSNAFLALQAVKDLPRYRGRKLPDGHTAREHCAAWTAYYRLYCDQRAHNGLYVEVDSPTYGKWLLPELVNLYEFADDPVLRRKMEMLLHLTWADWAADQLGGMRGGGKSRSYQGRYSQRGTANSWRAMGLILTGRGDWYDVRSGQANYVLGTTRYRLPEVVIDLASGDAERGEYVYTSLRPAKMQRDVPDDCPPLAPGIWYVLDSEDPRLVRYDYCTPDYILGSWLIDPQLGTTFRAEPGLGYCPRDNYAAISSQNRWQGVIFATHPDARVFPQCVGEKRGPHGHTPTFNQHVSVQHQNVCLVRKNRRADAAGDLRVFFAAGMKDRIVERGEWLFLQEGNAYLAAGVLPRFTGGSAPAWSWDDANWLRLKDHYAPAAFVTGRSVRYDTLEDFMAYVRSHRCAVTGGVLRYAFRDVQGRQITLEMSLERPELPKINGRCIDLKPERVYDCPYLVGQHGGGPITIRKGKRTLRLDFDRTKMLEVP